MSDLLVVANDATANTGIIQHCYRTQPRTARLGGHSVSAWQCAHAQTGESALIASGTLIYREEFADRAASLLLNDLNTGRMDAEELAGAYVVVWGDTSKIRLFTDPVGHLPAFRTSDGKAWSTSFLALAKIRGISGINEQGMFEYVFQGTSYHTDTPLENVQRVLPHGTHDPESCSFVPGDANTFLPEKQSSSSVQEALQESLERLRPGFRVLYRHFGDRVSTALSGGFDSRLVLALLQDAGCSPKIYVYGNEGDIDVKVAKTIAEQENFELDHIDKSLFTPTEGVEETVEHNHLLFDGLPIDSIFDSGVDVRTRQDRMKNEHILLNGGGGEIYRNFFYLPEGQYRASQLVDTFYSQFDPAVCRKGAFDEQAYREAISQKIISNIDPARTLLSRQEVEKTYPLFRLRFWACKNIAVNNRIGYSTTPLVEPSTIRNALSVPLAAKTWGQHQGGLINILAPRLAGYPSAYGRALNVSPGAADRLKLFLNLRKPGWLRRNSFRFTHRLTKSAAFAAWKIQYGIPLGLKPEVTSRYFHLERLTDPAQLYRVMTLEYLFQQVL